MNDLPLNKLPDSLLPINHMIGKVHVIGFVLGGEELIGKMTQYYLKTQDIGVKKN